MRVILLVLLAGCATNSSPTASALRKQIEGITHQPRRSFESPGDFTAESPSPDSGGAIDGDPFCDQQSCLPR